MKTKKCMGCGVKLQTTDPNKDGFIEEENYSSSNLCKRCFRMKNYNEYIKTSLSNDDFKNMLKGIPSDALKVYIIDLFDYDQNIIDNFSENAILVINKSDLLPKSVKDEKLIEYFENEKIKKCFVVSAKKNRNIDSFYNYLLKEEKEIYFIGNTNAGKTSLINKLIENYSDQKRELTTSYYPATTLDIMEVKINDEISILDTPGLINESSIVNKINNKKFKMIIPKKEVKPRTFQIKKETSLLVDDFFRIDTNDKNSLTFYLSNLLNVKINSYKNDKLKDLEKKVFNLKAREDLVVSGYFWMKVTKDCQIEIYTQKNIEISIRKSII